LQYKGEYTATREIRKFITYYVKGMPNAREFKDKINSIDSKESFYKIFK
jgi:tRNA-dihydrouridine synthase